MPGEWRQSLPQVRRYDGPLRPGLRPPIHFAREAPFTSSATELAGSLSQPRHLSEFYVRNRTWQPIRWAADEARALRVERAAAGHDRLVRTPARSYSESSHPQEVSHGIRVVIVRLSQASEGWGHR